MEGFGLPHNFSVAPPMPKS